MPIFESFEQRTLDYKKWISKAMELERSAEILADSEMKSRKEKILTEPVMVDESVSIMPQIIMLYAFSIENYLKGLLALRKRIKISDGKTVDLNHKLIDIIRKIGINVDEDTEQIINKFTRHIVWEGRYPAPINKSQLPKVYDSSNVHEWPNTYLNFHDIEISRSILVQIKEIIEHQIKHFDKEVED